jgi:hypothetical protein
MTNEPGTSVEVQRARAEESRLGRFVEGAHPYPEEVVQARKALRGLAVALRALSDGYGGELAAEARLAWLYSLLPVYDVEALGNVLGLVAEVSRFVDNWTDCVGSTTPSKARLKEEESTQYALAAVAVDALTAQEPEHLSAVGPVVSDRLRRAEARLDAEIEEDGEVAEAGLLEPAREATEAALVATLALVDAVRSRAPEEFQ